MYGTDELRVDRILGSIEIILRALGFLPTEKNRLRCKVVYIYIHARALLTISNFIHVLKRRMGELSIVLNILETMTAVSAVLCCRRLKKQHSKLIPVLQQHTYLLLEVPQRMKFLKKRCLHLVYFGWMLFFTIIISNIFRMGNIKNIMENYFFGLPVPKSNVARNALNVFLYSDIVMTPLLLVMPVYFYRCYITLLSWMVCFLYFVHRKCLEKQIVLSYSIRRNIQYCREFNSLCGCTKVLDDCFNFAICTWVFHANASIGILINNVLSCISTEKMSKEYGVFTPVAISSVLIFFDLCLAGGEMNRNIKNCGDLYLKQMIHKDNEFLPESFHISRMIVKRIRLYPPQLTAWKCVAVDRKLLMIVLGSMFANCIYMAFLKFDKINFNANCL